MSAGSGGERDGSGGRRTRIAFDSAWAVETAQNAKFFNVQAGGVKQVFEKPFSPDADPAQWPGWDNGGDGWVWAPVPEPLTILGMALAAGAAVPREGVSEPRRGAAAVAGAPGRGRGPRACASSRRFLVCVCLQNF